MKKLVFTLFLIFTLMTTFAQVDKTIVVGGNQKGDSNATMEILSKNGTKGFMPPRFTGAQMATLEPALNDSNKGLTVFNTDENCLQYWKGDEWSECDAISLAKFNFDCSSATAIKGSYYAGVQVGINNYIEITATVVKPGTYSFYTETVNGVRFSYTGIIATKSALPIKIQIPAVGIPTAVNSAVAYTVYDQSGKEVCTASNFTIPVTENNADFKVNCDNTLPIGTFVEDQPVNPVTNAVSLQLDVNNSGYYSLHTDTIGAGGADTGMWFEGTGYVTTSSAALITLSAKGTPKWGTDGKLTFTLYDKNNVAVGCTFSISLESVKAGYTPDCTVTGTLVNGVFVETKPATDANYITLKVNVTKPGPWKITTDTVKGVYFNGVGTFSTTGDQTVKLVSNGTAEPSSAGTYSFKLLDVTNKNAVLCTPASNIVIQANQSAMTCTGSYPLIASSMKIYNVVSGPTASLAVPIDFSATGPYNITATNAGVTLNASGTAAQTSSSISISFTVSGTPTSADNVAGIPFTFIDALGNSCVRNISITPTLGTNKTNPAKTCKFIKPDNAQAPDGEYWIKPTQYTGNPVKTLCDLSTGQTMVWSYSEQTARSIYMTATTGIPGSYSFNQNTPLNDQNFATEVLLYANFRTSLTFMQAVQVDNGTIVSLTASQHTTDNLWKIKVVSTLTNASDVSDQNGKNNYIDVTPQVNIALTSSGGNQSGYHPLTGKLKGVAVAVIQGGTVKYNGGSASGSWVGNPTYQSFYGYTGAPGGQPNYFGGFGTTSTVSGHFLDCNNGQLICGPTNLVVSPFNRVIQVFLY